MRWRIGWCVLLAGLAWPAHAQMQDWATVEKLKHGKQIIVETTLTPTQPVTFTHCFVETVTPAALTCNKKGWKHKSIVYPTGEVDAVYRVHMTAGAKFEAAASLVFTGVLIAGAATGNGNLFMLGVMGGGIEFCYMIERATGRLFRHIMGIPPDPFLSKEREEMIYRRGMATPVPTAASPF